MHPLKLDNGGNILYPENSMSLFVSENFNKLPITY